MRARRPSLLPVTDNPQRCAPRGRDSAGAGHECALVARRSTANFAKRHGLHVVHHEKERRRAGPRFASRPAPRQGAGRGHRRGLDGPSMPRPLKKMCA